MLGLLFSSAVILAVLYLRTEVSALRKALERERARIDDLEDGLVTRWRREMALRGEGDTAEAAPPGAAAPLEGEAGLPDAAGAGVGDAAGLGLPDAAAPSTADAAGAGALDAGEAGLPSAAAPRQPDAAGDVQGPRRPGIGWQRPALPPFEELIGAHLMVWVGAIALALAGAFLVKYTIDTGLLSPTVRVTLGVALGLMLMYAGDRVLENDRRVGAALSAAGVAVLFSSFYAATSLYGLIPAVAGFALMGLTAATAVGLSLRQGPIVAAVGLVGGYLTPYVVQSGVEPRAAPLFAYLLLLQAAMLAVTRRRAWWGLGALSILAGLGWVALWLMSSFSLADGPWLGLFLLLSVASFVAAAHVAPKGERLWRAEAPAWLGWVTVIPAIVIMILVTGAAGYGYVEWAFLGLLGAASIGLGRLDHRYNGLAWLAAGFTALALLDWLAGATAPERVSTFLLPVAALGAVFVLGSFAALWGARRPAGWSALAAASGVGYYLLAYLGATQLHRFGDAPPLPWGAAALVLAALAIAGCVPVLAKMTELHAGASALAALAAAATAFISLALVLELSREWIAVAWALEVAAVVWIAHRLGVPELRWLAWPLAAIVALGLLTPAVFTYPVGDLPIFNWLLYGYGISIAAAAGAAYLAALDGDARLSRMLQWGALALGFALLTLQVAQLFHPGRLTQVYRGGLAEWASYGIVWMVYGLACVRAARIWPLDSLALAGRGLVGVGLAEIFLFPVLFVNPAWWHVQVGRLPIVNWLIFAYGVPAALALVVRWELAAGGESDTAAAGGLTPPGDSDTAAAGGLTPPDDSDTAAAGGLTPPGDSDTAPDGRRNGGRAGDKGIAQIMAAAALVLGFVLVTLELRQAFRGEYLDRGMMSAAENYGYSLVWILYGMALLLAGIAGRGQLVRWASLAVMVLAVGKVFLVDMASLVDLYRVMSFLGLGASLIFLGWLYQRFVFGRPRSEGGPVEGGLVKEDQ